MAKVIPEETSTIFSESDYLIDLSSWFKDSITQEKISDLRE
ncbi:MAG TPA: transcriptional regulator, partial [Clostridium sp.]|nr:transcriptional regulator [Clostridium sp.]